MDNDYDLFEKSVRPRSLHFNQSLTAYEDPSNVSSFTQNKVKAFCTNLKCSLNDTKNWHMVLNLGAANSRDVKKSAVVCPQCEWALFWSRSYRQISKEDFAYLANAT